MNAATESFATEAGHWYRPDGSACYELVGNNGQTRPTTLRDARKLGLVPSVTTILKLEAKPQLENWKVNQACLSCLTLPRIAGESEDIFIARALLDSREQSRKAAERGSEIHGHIEKSLIAGSITGDLPIVAPVVRWLQTNFAGWTPHPERSFACSHGYGGKIDLVVCNAHEQAVIDFKCKADIIPGKKLAYEEHVTQLAAYAQGLGMPNARCINLFISTTTPELIITHEWDRADIDSGWEAFKCLLALWKIRKKL